MLLLEHFAVVAAMGRPLVVAVEFVLRSTKRSVDVVAAGRLILIGPLI